MEAPQKKIIIAGPCAVESEKQVIKTVNEALIRRVDFVRLPLWKPRTKPGFDGLGDQGLPFLVMATRLGICPATEVLTPDQAKKVIYAVLSKIQNTKILLWIGSRNQNHQIQKEIARVVAIDKRVFLLVKNQPWKSFEHWQGIVGHILESGIDKTNLFLCHRGFIPNGHNPSLLRNLPDYKMAMKIKDETGLPMLIDPSHIGGIKKNVFKIVKESKNYRFDGALIEVHPNPQHALTDARQQLTWKEFDKLMI